MPKCGLGALAVDMGVQVSSATLYTAPEFVDPDGFVSTGYLCPSTYGAPPQQTTLAPRTTSVPLVLVGAFTLDMPRQVSVAGS